MKRMLAILLTAAMMITAFSVTAFAEDGNAVVTKSYLEQVYLPQLKSAVQTKVGTAVSGSSGAAFASLAETVAVKSQAASKAEWAEGKSLQGRLTLKKGDVMMPLCGCKLTVLFGTVSGSDGLIDVTEGAVCGSTLKKNHLYMQSDDREPKLKIQSETAEITVNGGLKIAVADGTDYGSLADALCEMGLFKGRTLGYDLDSGATRAEGLTMFLRLLGLEKAALACTATVPFTDVPASHWSRPYVAYAYSMGLTNGTSETKFSPDDAVTAQHYLMFLMRALHYTEGTDFAWKTVLSDAVSKKMFSQGEITAMQSGKFLRSRMVYLSYYGLFCTDQEGACMLCDELIGRNVMTEDGFCQALMAAKGKRIS